MVIDFGDIKKIATEYVHDVLDHGFMVWDKDRALMKFFKENADQKHIVVPFVPTSENIAAWIFNQLDGRIFAQERILEGQIINEYRKIHTNTRRSRKSKTTT